MGDEDFRCEAVATQYTTENWELTGHWLERARRELTEDPSKTPTHLQALKDLLQGVPGLNSCTDDAFLIRFLRARKFNVSNAFKLVKRYYQMKSKHPELFRVDHTERLLRLVRLNMHGLLDGKDINGASVFIIRVANYTDDVSLDDFFRLNIVALEQAVRDPRAQVAGVCAVVDLKGFGLQHAPFVAPHYTRKTIDVVQEAFPIRFKGFHVLNQPFYFKPMYACIKPFIKEKMRKRVFLHGADVTGLQHAVPVRILPEEYGGPPGGFDPGRWARMLQEIEPYFRELESYGYASSDSVPPSECREDAEGREDSPLPVEEDLSNLSQLADLVKEAQTQDE